MSPLHMHGSTEKKLVADCLNGDQFAQKQFFQRFAPKMMSICKRYAGKSVEADDLMQEGFIRVFKNLHQFKFEGSLEGWIRRVMVHSSIKYITKRINRTEFSELVPENDIKVKAVAFSELSAQDLMKIITRLPVGYRTVFNMYAIEGYSHQEIASQLNIKPSTSRSQLVKARKMLQKEILKLQKMVG